MRILALDLSTSTGYCLGEGEMGCEKPLLLEQGAIQLEKTIVEYGKYPFCYYLAAQDMAERVFAIVKRLKPDRIVIEETNLGFSRYSQKALEMIHCLVLGKLQQMLGDYDVVYISSSTWRQKLGLQMTKEQKKANAKLAKATREAKAAGLKVDKKKLGIVGKVTQKHVAILHVNKLYDLKLKMKDDDIADAMCLTLAGFLNATPCDGT